MNKFTFTTEISYGENCTGVGECAGSLVCETTVSNSCLCSDEDNEYHRGDNECAPSKYDSMFSSRTLVYIQCFFVKKNIIIKNDF